MKSLIKAGVVGSILIGIAVAQSPAQPAMRKGVSVQMAVADHAVEARAADAPDAIVVAITAEGKVYAGVEVTEPGALGNLKPETVYLKADSRAPFQKVLAVLDALHGKSVVLLSASPKNAGTAGYVPPYGVKVVVPR